MKATSAAFSRGVSCTPRTTLKNSTVSSSVKRRPSCIDGGKSLIPRSVKVLIGPSAWIHISRLAEFWPQHRGVDRVAAALQRGVARVTRRATRQTEHRQPNEHMTSHRHRCLPERGPSFLWRVVGAPASHERSAYPPKPGTAGLRRPSPGSFERFGVSNYCRAARLARRAGEHSPTALGPEVRHPLLLRARPTLGSRSSGAPATRRSPRVHFEIAAGGGRGRHDTRAEEVAHGPVTRGPVVASVRMVIRADRGGAVVREAASGTQA